MRKQNDILPQLFGADSDSWDTAYEREFNNHCDDTEDEGTIWFSESNAEEAVLRLLNQLEEDDLLSRASSRFLDLGTGNGHLLFTLREEDEDGSSWQGEMVGVDYSEASVQLAQRIQKQRQLAARTSSQTHDAHEQIDGLMDGVLNGQRNEHLGFEQWDLLNDAPGDWLNAGFDMVLDKGTFDAISLMSHLRFDHETTPHPCDVYREKVIPLIKPGALLCITSCNWTKPELLDWLAPANGELEYFKEAKYPTFTYGGKTGQSIVTIVLRRRRP